MIQPEIIALKQRIIEELDGIIGTYTLLNGQTIPAIAVDQGNYPPQGTQVSGLEVVILPQADNAISPLLGGRMWEITSMVILKQWGEGTTLEAMTKIIPLLGNQVQIGARVLPDGSLGNIETLKITFTWNFLNRQH